MNKLTKTILATSLMVSASAINAAPASLPFTVTTTLGSNWDIDNTSGTSTGQPFTGSCDGSAGMSLNDAQSTTGDGDMYDDAWGIWVDGTQFVAPDPVDLTGTTVTAGPVAMSGLDVTMQYHFSDTIEAARILASFTNPTGSPISIQVEVPANFGSDGSTTIVTTSSGDTSFTTADGWAITWDNSSEINTSVFHEPGSVVSPSSYTTTVFDCAGTEGLGATFTVDVPAGATRRLAFFAGIAEIDGTGDSDTANATANAAQFNTFASIDTSLTSDLTAGELSEIVNWSTFAAAEPVPVPVPALNQFGLLLLSAMLALFGMRQVRKRRTS